MPDSTSLFAFVAAALVVLLIPGPGVMYVLARSLSQGQRAGLVSVLGLSAGAFVHVIAATVGLSALLVASAAAFGVVKLLGAGYLIYLGIRALLSREANAEVAMPAPRSLRRLFTDGVIVSVLNPKVAVFFLARRASTVAPARLHRLDPGRALLALAPYSNRCLAGIASALEALQPLADRVPVFDLGRGDIATMIERVEEAAAK